MLQLIRLWALPAHRQRFVNSNQPKQCNRQEWAVFRILREEWAKGFLQTIPSKIINSHSNHSNHSNSLWAFLPCIPNKGSLGRLHLKGWTEYHSS